jgi:plasmid stabilization system protein ParE
MTARRGFELHPLAAQDINAIWSYIAEDSPQAARRVREDILAAIRALVPFPNQGHKRLDLTSRPLRFTLVREYLIAYAPEETRWVIAGMRAWATAHTGPCELAASLTEYLWMEWASPNALERQALLQSS